MKWTFRLVDRYNTRTDVNEPAGWDSLLIKLSRDLNKHGLVFDFQSNSLQFDGRAAAIIKREYQTYASEGQLTLEAFISCGNVRPDDIYSGRLFFSDYEDQTGDECLVSISLETTSDLLSFSKLIDSKVDLQTTSSFNGVSLPAYSKLGYNLTLPGKAVLLKDAAKNEAAVSESMLGIAESTGSITYEHGMFSVAMAKQIASEIGGFFFDGTPTYRIAADASGNNEAGDPAILAGVTFPNYIWPLSMSPVVNYAEGMANYGVIPDPINLTYRVKGVFRVLQSTVNRVRLYLLRLKIGNVGDNASDYDYLQVKDLYVSSGAGLTTGSQFAFDRSFTTSFQLFNGDRIYLFGSVYHSKTSDQIDSEASAFTITYDENTYFELSGISRLPATMAKVFLVNEAISRVSETISDDKIRIYSEYFGRTDSQPYTTTVDGCGGLAAITKGLFIRRQENRVPGQAFKCAISIQELWEGLNPIHHLGMGFEPDPQRPGFNCLRVETWRHFYQADIVLTCSGIAKLKRTFTEQEVYNKFKFGFEKWEAEEYNGLDEFLTDRTYRTTLNQINNELTVISKFIASGYAWEITRRKDNDSKDWRFDKETFIVCLQRAVDEFEVELNNITASANIIDPATVYNFRISPLRNALRWIDKLFVSYRDQTIAKAIFVDGVGNYFASSNITGGCKLEAAVLTENQDIDYPTFSTELYAAPIMWPERISFDYALSLYDFNQIKKKSYGLIAFSNQYESGYGWIDNIEYKPEEGSATFILIPKI